jgi:hypothetical protein
MNGDQIELVAQKVRYLSEGDEDAFFFWLAKTGCSYRGVGDTLLISVERGVPDAVLRELLGLFHRYGIEMKQFAVFKDDVRRPWFSNINAYWFPEVF